jgi:hypothetical protein
MRKLIALPLAALALLFSACSSDPVQTASASEAAPKAPARRASTEPESAAEVVDTAPRSVFTVDNNSRDPFFPQTRAKVEEPGAQPEIALDVPAILQANLHGIISSGGKSIAYISNVMLEEGRAAVIPIRAGGYERQVNVRCREVTRDAVLLEVQGYTDPVRITRTAR